MKYFFILFTILFSLNVFPAGGQGGIQADRINPTVSGNAVNIPKVQVDNINLDANTVKSTSGDLVFDSAGVIKPSADFVPNNAGVDLGSASSAFQNIYSSGEHFGLKIENVTSGTMPTSSPSTKGRLVFATDIKKLYVDDGSSFIEASGSGGISAWQTANAYNVGSIVHTNNKIYLALIAHTSGTFATDLSNGGWIEVSPEPTTNANISDSVNKRFLTDAQLANLNNQSGINTGDLLTKGQADGSLTTTTQLQLPHKQLTTTAAGVRLAETDSTNELANSSFEAAGLTSSNVPDWSYTGTGISFSAETSASLSGAQSLKITKSTNTAWTLYQASTTNAAQQANVQKTCKAYVSANVSDLQLCSYKNGAEDKCTTSGGYVANSGKKLLMVSYLGGSTSNGCLLKGSTAGSIYVKNVTSGDGAPTVDFSNTSDTVDYTLPTPTGITCSSLTSTGKRVSDTLHWKGRCVVSSISSVFTFYLPSGLTTDVNSLPGDVTAFYDSANFYDFSTANSYTGSLAITSTNGVTMYGGAGAQWSATAPVAYGVGDIITWDVPIPIVEWKGKSSSAYVAESAQPDAVSYVNPPIGTIATTANSFYYQTKDFDNNNLYSSSGYRVPRDGYYLVSAVAVIGGTTVAGSDYLQLGIAVNGTPKKIKLNYTATSGGEITGDITGVVYALKDQYITTTTQASRNSTYTFSSTGRNSLSIVPVSGSVITGTFEGHNWTTERFSGNGSTTAFTLAASPATIENTFVSINGVLQQTSTYSISGTTLTFSEAPPSGTNNIEVRQAKINAAAVPSDGSVIPSKLGTQGIAFTPGITATNINSFSFGFGGASVTAACTVSPCTIYNQIGNTVTSVTRSTTGVYQANLSRTYSKLNCTSSAGHGTLYIASMVYSCTNCNNIGVFSGYQNGATATQTDTATVLNCQGEY